MELGGGWRGGFASSVFMRLVILSSFLLASDWSAVLEVSEHHTPAMPCWFLPVVVRSHMSV